MRTRVRLQFFAGAVLLAAFSGCTAEPENSMRGLISAMNSLADTFETVTDASSAEKAIDSVDQHYAATIEALKVLSKHKDAKMRKTLLDDLKSQMEKAGVRVTAQAERLKQVRGLPPKFWKVINVRSAELLIVTADANPDLPPGARDHFQKLKAFFDKHGSENVVEIELRNMHEGLRAKALERFEKAAPGIEVFDQTDWKFVMGPVKEFPKFIAALDMGQVEFEDAGQGRARIAVDARKLGGTTNANIPSGVVSPNTEQMRQDSERRHQEAVAAMEAARLRREEEEKKKRLDPNAPDYFEKLADRMLSTSPFEQSEAIDLLVRSDPAKVSSPETRAKIARGFKQLAEDGRFDQQRKSVKGLVVWGGKFSVPILIKMLDNRDPFLSREVIKALGDLKDERAAKPVAERLSDFHARDEAVSALRNMGPAAEDALIEIAPTEDAKLCLIAVNLLGDVGTPKSFKVLRMGVASRNLQVREASKNAIAKINMRKEAAEKEKPK